MQSENLIKDEDRFIKQLLHEYFPKNQGTNTDILTLGFLQKLQYDQIRCLSLKNEKVRKGWKNFLDRLPFSSDEVVLRPDDRFWRWEMYRKYIPEKRTDFRKKMKAGPNFDHLNKFPITGEDMHLYRHSSNYQIPNIEKILQKRCVQ